ncbi:MAG TPA: RHS repeat-associated core domain-containing protein [Deltaproteobacteria bacterium]|nr:RHS repeat-associated core domain-containing protein [Deltaproteobacteria bacterium]HOI06469.1 RHS repeat-associated core domain-containing protein [Deltaproteobacteria bacterium]
MKKLFFLTVLVGALLAGTPALTHAAGGERYEYDILDRVTDVYVCADGAEDRNTYHYEYDAALNTVYVYNELNYMTGYTYESFGDPDEKRLVRVKLEEVQGPNPDWYYVQGSTTCQYTAAGKIRQASQTSGGRTITHSYVYDSRQFLVSESHPETGTVNYSHDAAGNVISRRDARGTVGYSYDEAGRLLDITYPSPTPSVSYAYDNADNVINATSYVGMTPVSSTNYAYTPDDRLSGKTYVYNVGGTKVSASQGCTYNGQRSLERVTYPSGRVVTYRYHPDGIRVQHVHDSVTDTYLAADIAYHPSGDMEQYTSGNGITTTIGHDGYQRVSRVSIEGVRDIRYGYTACDDIESISYGNTLITLSYDCIRQLHDAYGPWGQLTFGHDYFGNRTSLARHPSNDNHFLTSYTYDTTNRLASSRTQIVEIGGGGQYTSEYSYDGSGNMTNNSARTFGYSLAGHLTTVDGSQVYWYDDKGNRIRKNEGQTATLYHYGPSGEVLGESDASGSPTCDYIYLNGRVIAKYVEASGTLTYFHHDALGNTVAQTDGSGAVVMLADYEPFGAATMTGTREKRLFTGKEHDVTGLDYFGARYYDPALGRFLSPDPAGPDLMDPQSYNRYAYCFNSPYRFVDPDGEWGEDIHYEYTLRSARTHFPEIYARVIASADARVDSYSGGKSFLPVFGNQSYHFNTSGKGKGGDPSDSRIILANSHLNKAVALWKASLAEGKKGLCADRRLESRLRTRALVELGTGLHAFQDVTAHNDVLTHRFLGFLYHNSPELSFGLLTNYADSKKWNIYGHMQVQKDTDDYIKKFTELAKK